MRIDATATPRSQNARPSSAARTGARFTLPGMAAPQAARPSAAVSAPQALDALLAIQAVEPEKRRRKRALTQGHDLLDALDAMKVDLLGAGDGHAALQRLERMLDDQRERTADPALNEVLDAIALRAAVERAKRQAR